MAAIFVGFLLARAVNRGLLLALDDAVWRAPLYHSLRLAIELNTRVIDADIRRRGTTIPLRKAAAPRRAIASGYDTFTRDTRP